MRRFMFCGLVLLALPGCGDNIKAQGPDAASVDAPGIDAMVAQAAPSETVSGSGRVTGGTMTMDLQVGHGVSQKRAVGGSKTIEGAASVKP